MVNGRKSDDLLAGVLIVGDYGSDRQNQFTLEPLMSMMIKLCASDICVEYFLA